jgi:hypothetical protein
MLAHQMKCDNTCSNQRTASAHQTRATRRRCKRSRNTNIRSCQKHETLKLYYVQSFSSSCIATVHTALVVVGHFCHRKVRGLAAIHLFSFLRKTTSHLKKTYLIARIPTAMFGSAYPACPPTGVELVACFRIREIVAVPSSAAK